MRNPDPPPRPGARKQRHGRPGSQSMEASRAGGTNQQQGRIRNCRARHRCQVRKNPCELLFQPDGLPLPDLYALRGISCRHQGSSCSSSGSERSLRFSPAISASPRSRWRCSAPSGGASLVYPSQEREAHPIDVQLEASRSRSALGSERRASSTPPATPWRSPPSWRPVVN